MSRRFWKIYFSLLVSLLLCPGQAHAARQVFGRNVDGLTAGRAGGFGFNVNVGQFDPIPPFGRIVELKRSGDNQKFQIGRNGALNIFEQRQNGLTQRLALSGDGRVIGLGDGGEVNSRVRDEVATLLGANQIANRDPRVQLLVAQNTGNPGAFNGRFRVSLTPLLDKSQWRDIPECVGRELKCALASLNEMVNQVNNGARPLRYFEQDLKRLPNGEIVADVNLGRDWNRNQLNILAQSDPVYACTGRMRVNTAVNFMLNPDISQDVKGVRGMNEEQIDNLFGCDFSPQSSFNDRILILGADGKKESLVTSYDGRITRWVRNRRVPGRRCWGSDDFAQNQFRKQGTDARQVSIFDAPNAKEKLYEQPNGLFFGALYNNKGVIQRETPSSVTTPKVLFNVSCMGCHSRCLLGGGRKIQKGGRTLEQYHNNLANIPKTPTIFRSPFGGQLTTQDFFTDNKTYRKTANDSCKFQFRQKKKMGLMEVLGSDGYPLPFAEKTFEQYDEPLSPQQLSRESGIPVETLRSKYGITTTVSRGAADNFLKRNDVCAEMKSFARIGTSRPPGNGTGRAEQEIH